MVFSLSPKFSRRRRERERECETKRVRRQRGNREGGGETERAREIKTEREREREGGRRGNTKRLSLRHVFFSSSAQSKVNKLRLSKLRWCGREQTER
ncbi:hypothetical protein FHG87_013807 [Trinorchestia longiramus]|nr:hypothetical protein FHG87_013807 [Trinorchestia longiramus]